MKYLFISALLFLCFSAFSQESDSVFFAKAKKETELIKKLAHSKRNKKTLKWIMDMDKPKEVTNGK